MRHYFKYELNCMFYLSRNSGRREELVCSKLMCENLTVEVLVYVRITVLCLM